ncbi:MAG: hypothetical protein HC875_26665 [Anaerolineales bacterium]|nr:hypothetical protein [Anaerolineales bacterium]
MESKALLMAFYLDEKDEALLLLQEAIDLARYNNKFIAKCKTSMGDIYLLKGEPWEATLLYSQAEKLQKDSPIAYESKLKNAKLNYYKGDFELAQSHLDILKMATSREIANDAMELSLLIKRQPLARYPRHCSQGICPDRLAASSGHSALAVGRGAGRADCPG